MISAVSGAIGTIVNIWQGFDIPTWVWIALAILGLFIAQFLAFHKVTVERDELRTRASASTLQSIVSHVFIIEPLDHWFIDITPRLAVQVGFTVSPTMRLESVRLDLMDKSIPSDWSPRSIGGAPEKHFVHFDFPDWVNTGEHTVKLVAFAEGIKSESKAFTITFSQERLLHKVD